MNIFKGSGCRTFGIMGPINLLSFYEAQSKHHNSSSVSFVIDTVFRPASKAVADTTVLTGSFTYYSNLSYLSTGSTELLLHPSKANVSGTCTPAHAPGHSGLRELKE